MRTGDDHEAGALAALAAAQPEGYVPVPQVHLESAKVYALLAVAAEVRELRKEVARLKR